jgi:hypothetical protein
MKTLNVDWVPEREVEVGVAVVGPVQPGDMPATDHAFATRTSKLIVITKCGAILHQCVRVS